MQKATVANNTFENIESYEYFLRGGSEMTIESQHFKDDRISGGSETNIITISNSGVIAVVDSDDGSNSNHNTNDDSYIAEISDKAL